MAHEKASSSKPSQSAHLRNKKHNSKPYAATGKQDAADLPGVQKIKSSIRQTRRLLGKDNLAADVRVETERRLKSLEADLELAERKRKERAFAIKYHKVKFFERKKVLRKIKQANKDLEADGKSKQSSNAQENALFELRVDLNYILHYPKLERYISLFPAAEESDETSGNETKLRRESLRNRIREQMEEGELSMTPELDMEQGLTSESKLKTRLPMTRLSNGKSSPTSKKGREIGGDHQSNIRKAIKDDDFFNAGSDSDT